MNHYAAQRNLRAIEDPDERYREWKIKKVQATFDLDRETAAQTYEWIELKFANQTFAGVCGLVAAYYVHKKLTPILQARSFLFKKPWMVPVIPFFFGYCAYHGSKQLRGRQFGGRMVEFEKMSGSNDVISRFRDLDELDQPLTPKEKIANYLQNSCSCSRKELSEVILDCLPQEESANKKIARVDRDTDDIYWNFGRIHGLENIAFLDDDTLMEAGRDPIALQMAINSAIPKGPPAASFDGLVSAMMCCLDKNKQQINKFSLTRSDRSKLLALPFFTQRRVQGPAPREGQWQYDLFTELAGGKDWNHYETIIFDNEKKITPHDYEKHLSPSLLEKIDTNSNEFKKSLKLSCLLSQTEYEKHQELKEKYRAMMNTLAFLNEEEGRALIHLLKNKHRNETLEELHGGILESKLAKISEEENYLKKDRHRLEKVKLQFADRSRLPVEKAKVKDMFRHAAEFKHKFDNELGLYDTIGKMYDGDNRIIQSFINVATTGPLAKLKSEIGLDDRYPTRFLRVKDFKELKESNCEDPVLDHSRYYFYASHYIPLDMTDYEEEFLAMNDFGPTSRDQVPGIAGSQYLWMPNPYDRDQTAVGFDLDEAPKPNYFLTTAAEEAAGEEEDDDDDEGEGGDEEAPDTFWSLQIEEPYKPEPEEEPEWPYPYRYDPIVDNDVYIRKDQSVRDKFDEIELDSFMKFLDVKPFRNWEDTAHHHDRLGIHVTEDESQQVDPEYHILAEVERGPFEKVMFQKHRNGSTVRFATPKSKPHFGSKID